MKLYFSPGACSLATHIVLCELDLPFELIKVDLKTKKTANGDDFFAISPNGYVPALEVQNGQVLTEGVAILQYLADVKPAAQLAPANGTWERVRLQETLNFIAGELHGTMAPLFNPAVSKEVKPVFIEKLTRRLGFVAQKLGQHDYISGAQFTVADAYLFTILGWTKYFAIDLNQWPAIAVFMERMHARPAVKAALAAEATV